MLIDAGSIISAHGRTHRRRTLAASTRTSSRQDVASAASGRSSQYQEHQLTVLVPVLRSRTSAHQGSCAMAHCSVVCVTKGPRIHRFGCSRSRPFLCKTIIRVPTDLTQLVGGIYYLEICWLSLLPAGVAFGVHLDAAAVAAALPPLSRQISRRIKR